VPAAADDGAPVPSHANYLSGTMPDFLPSDPLQLGLLGLFVACLLAATVLPGGSEAALLAFLHQFPEHPAAALLLATLGNTLGGLSTYAGGRWLPGKERAERLPQITSVRRYGAPALILAWLPIVGDAFCLAAGWLRLNWLACTAWMATGKLARYWVVALWMSS
jgi:membrane protein YqaA with SNARE-associated domain